ncbi:hypothetical protein CROQUDRAFT_65603 [Cronartium quercuum f. sp. fusiforme G11]|uniref:Wax synthase domain-containing protein n=1 Tax=Cronartium quercuum f. sp. fusiforme G11 TaxID=708437 RepID=A0A9P6NHX1_9BASI|nr:hypothetical protein CROQUDRAFT_65603 [Cronartium quercuum f. sp. fusiforme G11]
MSSIIHHDQFASEITIENLTSFHQTAPARAFLPYILIILQGALLHPKFSHSTFARWTKMGLTPIIVTWGIGLPFLYSFMLSETANPWLNLMIALLPIWAAFKSLEWGFVSGSHGYRRPLKIINRMPRWEKVKGGEEEEYKKAQQEKPSNAFKLALWGILQMMSMRGLQLTWGPSAVPNNRSISSLVRRLFRVTIPLNATLSFILLTRDSPLGTPTSGLMSIGVPNFTGLEFISETLYTFAFGGWIASSMDTIYTSATLIGALIHRLAVWFRFPEELLELFDPINCPPIFDSPYKSTSLSELWGKRWQTLLQRLFLITGKKPMIWVAKKFGAKEKTQKLLGFFGVFASSGILHEYAAYALAPQDAPLWAFRSFPGAFFFFMIQPIGILLEPKIIPWIPKRLGGGTLWVLIFSLLTAYPYRVYFLGEVMLHAKMRPLSEWSWMYTLSPFKW